MIKPLDNETYNRLKLYEDHLNRGYRGNYIFGLTRKVFDELCSIYRELGYTKRQNYNCNGCLLDLTKTLGRLYFNYEPTPEPETKKTAVKVQQYTLEGELVAEYDSISEAGRQTGISKGSISSALKSGKNTGNYVWKSA